MRTSRRAGATASPPFHCPAATAFAVAAGRFCFFVRISSFYPVSTRCAGDVVVFSAVFGVKWQVGNEFFNLFLRKYDKSIPLLRKRGIIFSKIMF